MKLRKIILLALTVPLIFPSGILATEFEISGNGENSSSEVQVSQTTATNVVQNNNANITNDININANTGNNSIEQSTGESSIDTGNVITNISIVNQANASVNQSDQTTSSLNAFISGNGTDSQNSIVNSQTNNSINVVNNVANISTIISGIVNTGYNKANSNSGDVSITTGNILIKQLIQNGQINSSITTVKQSKNQDISALIKSNGSGSVNQISSDQNMQKQSFVNNNAFLNNKVNWDLNTGWNSVNRNSGGVNISTGNIFTDLIIRNTNINSNILAVVCDPGKQKEEDKPPSSQNPPGSKPNGSSIALSSGGSSSGVGGPQIIGLSKTSGQ